MSSEEKLYALFTDGTRAGKNATEICKFLQIPYREKKRLTDLLDGLCED